MFAQHFVGCAGWSIPKGHVELATAAGSHLERYARVFSAVEINSSFYRSHRRSTYERWGTVVPPGFRFSVKAPKTITHERRLVDVDDLLSAFHNEIAGLGERLGCILFQLPPSLTFEAGQADQFFQTVREQMAVTVACEPRHPSWFTPIAETVLTHHRITRVAADPAVVTAAAEPGGWDRTVYFRWHGSPRIYYSTYDVERLRTLAARVHLAASEDRAVWCIFDNTALGEAFGNALSVVELLSCFVPVESAADSVAQSEQPERDGRVHRT